MRVTLFAKTCHPRDDPVKHFEGTKHPLSVVTLRSLSGRLYNIEYHLFCNMLPHNKIVPNMAVISQKSLTVDS